MLGSWLDFRALVSLSFCGHYLLVDSRIIWSFLDPPGLSPSKVLWDPALSRHLDYHDSKVHCSGTCWSNVRCEWYFVSQSTVLSGCFYNGNISEKWCHAGSRRESMDFFPGGDYSVESTTFIGQVTKANGCLLMETGILRCGDNHEVIGVPKFEPPKLSPPRYLRLIKPPFKVYS